MTGCRNPRIESLPAQRDDFTAGEEAIDLAWSGGLQLELWQCDVVREMMARDEQGKWSAFEAVLIASRRNGKSAAIVAVVLWHLIRYGRPGYTVLWSAHKLDAALEAFSLLEATIRANPALLNEVKPRGWHRTNGKEGISFRNGARLKITARSKNAGRAFDGDLIVLDEALFLDDRAVGAMLPTLATRENPQVIYASSAGLDESVTLANLRARGIADDDPDFLFLEWSADVGADLDDVNVWAQANPSLGRRITVGFLRKMRKTLAASPAVFAREYLSMWDENAVGGPFSEAMWERLADPARPEDDYDGSSIADDSPLAFGVEAAWDSSRFAIAVAGTRAVDGEPHLELAHVLFSVNDTVATLKRMVDAEPDAAVVIDPGGPAGSLMQPLAAAGVEVVALSTRQYGQACGLLFDRIRTGAGLHHAGTGAQPELAASITALRKRKIGEAFGWERQSDDDVAPAGAATIALWAIEGEQDPADPLKGIY